MSERQILHLKGPPESADLRPRRRNARRQAIVVLHSKRDEQAG